MDNRRLFGVVLFAMFVVHSCGFSRGKSNQQICPGLFGRTFKGYMPQGNLTAGVFDEIPEVDKLQGCVLSCCKKINCNVAFMANMAKCYHISCYSNELCLPVPTQNPDAKDVAMVLVKPTDRNSWEDVLRATEYSKEELNREMYDALAEDPQLQDLLMDDSLTYPTIACGEGFSRCMSNERCIRKHPSSRQGICECKEGFMRNQDGECAVNIDLRVGYSSLPEMLTERILDITAAPNKTESVTRKHLTVSVESKVVRLPENEVTLAAKVEENEETDERYQYEWTSLAQPEGSTAVQHQDGHQFHLEKLSEGVYAFKVSVSSTGSYGENFVNVTVLPASRINKPPVIVITPANQTIKQPNSAAVLDASSSSDDDGITSWHWVLQQGPLGYQPELKDSPTLQLSDLTKPGNYSFNLTVTDTDKASSWGIANITVLKFTDYPPEANAGEDKVIYLPQNSIVLNGNLSIDDHAITTWEWTKSTDDAEKAVDMQDTRTPYLKLSKMEEGIYTFTLRVTDSAGQSNTAQVHVFVKPPTNKPPEASAGKNITISLPQTWALLDASNSTDDNKIESFKWEKVDGPSNVVFNFDNSTKSNVTGLTKGVYTFKVSVTDDNKNVATDLTYVIVNQNKNQKPTANAGGNFTVELPRNAIFVNGSKSKDDWAIVKWKWIRDDRSLAIGRIAEKSDESPVLILTNVGVGSYVFNLTVFDEQGLSDTNQVTFVVKSDPKLFYLVEITIDVDPYYVSEAQYNKLKGKLALLVIDGSKLQVRHINPVPGTTQSKITFYVEGADGKALSANEVVQHLRQKLRVDASLLGFSVAKLQTVICQNNCSGHGVCNERTRQCVCEAFWMQDLFKVYWNSYEEDSDCSWSILYVVLGVVCSVLLFIGSMWGLAYLCYSWCTKHRLDIKPTTYKLIEDTEDLPPFSSRKNNLSDSDTDSDVVFETRSKPSRFSDSRNGHKSMRNGFSKPSGRRIKA